MNNYFQNIDHEWLYQIQNHRLFALDFGFQWVSHLSTFIVISCILAVGITAFVQKSAPLKQKFYTLVFIEILVGIFIFLLKNIFHRTRPYVSFPDIQKLGSGGGFSFPSGHTSEAFCFAFSFILVFYPDKRFRYLLIWPILVAYSRMILGVHYPFDILGGFCTGILCAYLGLFLYSKLFKRKNELQA